MTAIVGVLNKHGIAVAADSAETVGEGVKIYNKANKIFTLSKHFPVGIAVYSSASFNFHIPWEIVIKMYRKELGEGRFDTLQEYVTNFFEFLKDYQNAYLTKEDISSSMGIELHHFWVSEVVSKLPNHAPNSLDIDKADISLLGNLLASYIDSAVKVPKIPELVDIDLATFSSYVDKSFVSPIVSQIVSAGGDKHVFESLITETLFEVFTRQCITRPFYTGLAFFGYGEKEIYPALYESLVYNSFAGKLYWIEKDVKKIDNQLQPPAFIHPMAQKDVMQTYIEGISPQIEKTFMQITEVTMQSFLTTLKNTLKTNQALSNALGMINLDPFMQHFQNSITQFKERFTIGPLKDTVATMEKEDLAELAENLIYLTSLKRRITPNLESVGGPVDVAIVSKGDGFIWLKRKHYFEPELNRHFFDKYFKS